MSTIELVMPFRVNLSMKGEEIPSCESDFDIGRYDLVYRFVFFYRK